MERRLWDRYSRVSSLMNELPFVRHQHEKHVRAMKRAGVILDAGCGSGAISLMLASARSSLVIGVDRSLSMLAVARERARHPKVTLVSGDVEELPFPDSMVDGYVSNNVLFAVEDPDLLVSEMARVTARGGCASVASARPCMNVEVLLAAMREELAASEPAVSRDDFEAFATINRSLQNNLRNLYEPEEFARRLEESGAWRVMEKGTSYLDQGFFVTATRI